ncbi:carnitine dehydratase [Roseovarius sp. HI0049]|nr:carnitine dehydratase [Roseovarius sp. HI0049]
MIHTSSLPLAGVRVVEICQIAAGPFCGMLLADMGAEVIKIEPPTGDAMRTWPPITDGYSENFASLNRNKKSIALDLKDDGDYETARALISRADIVVENSRPGVMERLKLDYARAKTWNPALIYCSISAFGQTGPKANQGAFDVTMQALSGIMSVTGHEGVPPVKCGVPIADFATGLYGAFNAVSALMAARQSGQGAHIDASMLGCSLGIAALQTSEYFGTGNVPRKLGAAHPRNSPYEAYAARDTHFVIAAGNDRLWAQVCAVTGMEELKDDPRFLTTSDRAANQEELKPLLEQRFVEDTAEEWLARFSAAGVPCAPINTYPEALADPQVEAQGWVQRTALPSGVEISTFGPPVSMSDREFTIRSGPPGLDGDRDAILAELAAEKVA